LSKDDLEGAIRELKAARVLGHGKPYFAAPRPPLRLMANDRIGEDMIRLAYVPA